MSVGINYSEKTKPIEDILFEINKVNIEGNKSSIVLFYFNDDIIARLVRRGYKLSFVIEPFEYHEVLIISWDK